MRYARYFRFRCFDLDLLTIGLVMDIWTEKGNDGTQYAHPRLILIVFRR
jgi:hypothetical protein